MIFVIAERTLQKFGGADSRSGYQPDRASMILLSLVVHRRHDLLLIDVTGLLTQPVGLVARPTESAPKKFWRALQKLRQTPQNGCCTCDSDYAASPSSVALTVRSSSAVRRQSAPWTLLCTWSSLVAPEMTELTCGWASSQACARSVSV